MSSEHACDPMQRCAFLTTDNLDNFVHDDDLAIAPMRKLAWEVEYVNWRAPDVDWNDFDAVVIRTTWDYQRDCKRFLDVLETVERSRSRLENNLELVRWGLDKRYLENLEGRGIPIVPSLFLSEFDGDGIGGAFDELATEELVIKPVLGANAEFTHRIHRERKAEAYPVIMESLAGRDCIVQPFMAEVLGEGEYSLIFFGGEFSHAIIKNPAAGDFRTQEEYGATLTLVDPPQRFTELGERAIAALDSKPLYARVDLVAGENGSPVLMEFELVEPSLYLRMDPGAPDRFAKVFDNWMHS